MKKRIIGIFEHKEQIDKLLRNMAERSCPVTDMSIMVLNTTDSCVVSPRMPSLMNVEIAEEIIIEEVECMNSNNTLLPGIGVVYSDGYLLNLLNNFGASGLSIWFDSLKTTDQEKARLMNEINDNKYVLCIYTDHDDYLYALEAINKCGYVLAM